VGDPRRFSLLADLIQERFPDTRLPIADVAAGKGHLKAALYLRGYRKVTAWDRRRKLAKARPGQKFQLFDYRNAPRDYRLVLGMHPDEATDQIILYAAKHRVPFVVCPCCTKPSAVPYEGPTSFSAWANHLRALARGGRMVLEEVELPMGGRNLVLVGRPQR
jgi:hypothetical protein